MGISLPSANADMWDQKAGTEINFQTSVASLKIRDFSLSVDTETTKKKKWREANGRMILVN